MPTVPTGIEVNRPEVDDTLESELYARHAEVNSFADLEKQRGTPIPALFNQFYKFIQNPSTVSVETFKRMIDTDDTIGSGVDFLVTCLTARLGAYTHPSENVTEFVQKALARIHGGPYAAFKELLSATWAGFAVQEKVWANTEIGFIVRELITLPPSTILFETDFRGKLTEDGILQYQRNYNPQVLSRGIGFFGSAFSYSSGNTGFVADTRPDAYARLGDLPFPLRTANTYNYLSIRIPKVKAIHYAFDAQGKFGNPFGRSLLRRIYKYYVMKDAFLQMMSTALDRKGTPLTIVYADPNTTMLDGSKYVPGAPVSSQAKIRADQAAKEAFKNIHNDTTIILPGKKDQIYSTDFVPSDPNTSAFIEALEYCNKGIMRGLLIPPLVLNGGDGSGSYSLGSEHAKTFDKILDGMLEGFKQTILDQLIKELIAYNFPQDVWKKEGLGDFSKRELTGDEREKEMNMYMSGISSGIIDSNDLNDLNKMRDTMGFDRVEKIIEKPEPLIDEGNNALDFGE